MSFLNNLNWRFATKEFDTKQVISKKNLDKILKIKTDFEKKHLEAGESINYLKFTL